MKLPIINLKGYTVGYNNDDFVRDTYTLRKTFLIGDLKYVFIYSPKDSLITFYIQNNLGYATMKISKEFLRDVNMDLLKEEINYLKLRLQQVTNGL